MKKLFLILSAVVTSLLITACDKSPESTSVNQTNTEKPNREVPTKIKSNRTLTDILAAQPEEIKMRYKARHPKEILNFFGIKPGMTVVEALPGRGWYTKILLPYIGNEGKLIGADYAEGMYPKFGFFDEKFIAAKKTWVTTWTTQAKEWLNGSNTHISAFQLGSMPESMNESADAFLFIRALHNLARFENDGGYLTAALNDAYQILKPGGIVGVVQHIAPLESDNQWANGSKGYLKKSFVISSMEKAGFEYAGSSDINLNLLDQPSKEDIVWRLPPSLSTSKDSPELKAKYLAIGESSRMTLAFRKPEKTE